MHGPDTDACMALTPAQVGTTVGVPVAAGKHVTPTFVKTCPWNASSSSDVKFVTLYLQTAAAYDGGKQMASQMAAAGRVAAVKPAAVGDDGYYFVAGDQVGLLVQERQRLVRLRSMRRFPSTRRKRWS